MIDPSKMVFGMRMSLEQLLRRLRPLFVADFVVVVDMKTTLTRMLMRMRMRILQTKSRPLNAFIYNNIIL